MQPGHISRRSGLSLARLLCSLALCAGAGAADVFAQLTDVTGSKDPTGIKRYEGSIIIGYDFRKFDGVEVLLGPVKEGPAGESNKLTASKSEQVEGQAVRILYVAPEDRSPLEIVRNYEQELKKNGFETVYQCAREKCGAQEGWLGEYYLYPLKRRLSQTPARGGGGAPQGQISEYALAFAKDDHYLVAKRANPLAYASVYVAINGFNHFKETFGHPIVLLDLVETAPMESKMVTVDAGTMAKDIATTGHIALYGIYFDHDKADVKPESAPTLAEIAKLLKADPKLSLYVVGHTDNVGTYDYNVALSDRRATAVVKELTSKHGIAAAQLKPAGIGPLAPVAPNDTEEGRAKNRRVELVKR
jgi:outer membrane protein OmpA-like peptidoglycan-associated protein